MKVILLKDVQKIGRKYDVKNVADGFALNFLIPNGAAKLASVEALKKVEALKAELEADKKVQEELLAKNLEALDGKEVTIAAKANEKGHLFAALHAGDIVSALKDSLHADVLQDFVVWERNIKETGSHDIEIKAGGKTATVKVVVEAK